MSIATRVLPKNPFPASTTLNREALFRVSAEYAAKLKSSVEAEQTVDYSLVGTTDDTALETVTESATNDTELYQTIGACQYAMYWIGWTLCILPRYRHAVTAHKSRQVADAAGLKIEILKKKVEAKKQAIDECETVLNTLADSYAYYMRKKNLIEAKKCVLQADSLTTSLEVMKSHLEMLNDQIEYQKSVHLSMSQISHQSSINENERVVGNQIGSYVNKNSMKHSVKEDLKREDLKNGIASAMQPKERITFQPVETAKETSGQRYIRELLSKKENSHIQIDPDEREDQSLNVDFEQP